MYSTIQMGNFYVSVKNKLKLKYIALLCDFFSLLGILVLVTLKEKERRLLSRSACEWRRRKCLSTKEKRSFLRQAPQSFSWLTSSLAFYFNCQEGKLGLIFWKKESLRWSIKCLLALCFQESKCSWILTFALFSPCLYQFEWFPDLSWASLFLPLQ